MFIAEFRKVSKLSWLNAFFWVFFTQNKLFLNSYHTKGSKRQIRASQIPAEFKKHVKVWLRKEYLSKKMSCPLKSKMTLISKIKYTRAYKRCLLKMNFFKSSEVPLIWSLRIIKITGMKVNAHIPIANYVYPLFSKSLFVW